MTPPRSRVDRLLTLLDGTLDPPPIPSWEARVTASVTGWPGPCTINAVMDRHGGHPDTVKALLARLVAAGVIDVTAPIQTEYWGTIAQYQATDRRSLSLVRDLSPTPDQEHV